MQRFRIEVGRDDGVRPGNIVGAVANEAGLNGSDIGPISIHGQFSTIDLPADLSTAAVEKLKRAWVSGKQLQLRPFHGRSSERDSKFAPRRPRSAMGGKPFGGRPGGFKASAVKAKRPKAAGKPKRKGKKA